MVSGIVHGAGMCMPPAVYERTAAWEECCMAHGSNVAWSMGEVLHGAWRIVSSKHGTLQGDGMCHEPKACTWDHMGLCSHGGHMDLHACIHACMHENRSLGLGH